MAVFDYYPRSRLGVAAIVALICAVGSLLVSCGGHGVLGIILGLISVPIGLVGFVSAASPRIRGAFLSLAAVIIGSVGVVLGIAAVAFHVVVWPLRF